ncbi:MAG: DUF6475 domain-containing protein [Candidatus Nanopelagicales bacterium]
MTDREFGECMVFLSAAVGRSMPEAQANAWRAICDDLTAIELQRGIVHALREHPVAGFPPIGNILKHAKPVVTVDAETRAVAAWEGVLETIRKVGGYSTIQFDDPAVTATIRAMGGWVRLTEQPTEELVRFVRPQFLQTYKALAATGVRAESAEPLIGLLDADNLRKGIDPEVPHVVRLGLPGPTPRLLPGIFHPQKRIAADEPAGGLFITAAERIVDAC